MILSFRGSNCRRSRGSTWYDRMDSLLMTLGFNESKADSNLFFKVEGGRPVMLLLHVDDLFLIEKRNSFKVVRRILASEFEMKDLDMMHYFLSMEVWKNVDGVSLGQGKYAVEILKRFGGWTAKP